ncbi:hypothetical protein B7463_g10564, partial [Scytalidium lignicola]
MKHSEDEITPSTGYQLLLMHEESESSTDDHSNVRLRVSIICFVSVILSLTFVLLISTVSTNLNISTERSYCHDPALRQEWRMLSIEARQSYIAAVQCLSDIPSRLGLNSTRYDDFVYSHLGMFNKTHRVTLSLPWHRWYIQQYEDALRNECGYWDWTLDAADTGASPIWSNKSGFGGNGSSPNHCLDYGPLANMAPQYPEPHCLRRNFAAENMHARNYTAALVENLISNSNTYEEFRGGLEDGPHRWVHRGIGGEMPLPWSTNGPHRAFISCSCFAFTFFSDKIAFLGLDPIFFVHHAQIDRLWWKWQNRMPKSRGSYATLEEGSKTDMELELLQVPQVSRREPLKLYGLGEDKIVEDLMLTESTLLCYKYPML